jgi:hypothetical protein
MGGTNGITMNVEAGNSWLVVIFKKTPGLLLRW